MSSSPIVCLPDQDDRPRGKNWKKNDVKYCYYKVNEEKSLKQQQKKWGRKKSENEDEFFFWEM